MKYTGHLTRVSKTGKIRIPLSVLNEIEIETNSTIVFKINDNDIIIEKQYLTCMVTGETSEKVKDIFPGIQLSEEGMNVVLRQLKDHLNKNR